MLREKGDESKTFSFQKSLVIKDGGSPLVLEVPRDRDAEMLAGPEL